MALESGKPPLRLLDDGFPDSWSQLDLEILSQWRHLKEAKCPGCGRALSQHLHNSRLGREETPEDYTPWALDCPAIQSVSEGQSMWRTANEGSIKKYRDGTGPDPALGTYWLAQAPGETLPSVND